MDFRTHVIKVVFEGKAITVHYWADGKGRRVHKYCTSLSQLRSKLKHSFHCTKLDLYCISSNRHVQPITAERHLLRVLANVRNGGTLFINAYNHNDTGLVHRERHHHHHHHHHHNHWDSDSDSSEEEHHYHYDDHHDHEWNSKDIDDILDGHNKYVKGTAISDIIDHFVVYDEECYHCHKESIQGCRFVYKKNHHYNICLACYKKLSRSDKTIWKECKLPWSYSAPAGPLYRNKENDDVRHLQYILTYLGYMKLSDTSILVGCFGDRTEAAIKKFRLKHGIYGGDKGTYDYKTAKKLAEVVHRHRRAGHYYL